MHLCPPCAKAIGFQPHETEAVVHWSSLHATRNERKDSGGLRIAAVGCQYLKVHLAERVLDSLAKAVTHARETKDEEPTMVPCMDVYVWLNRAACASDEEHAARRNVLIRAAHSSSATGAFDEVFMFDADPLNVGGLARFVVACHLTKRYDIVLFFDDDLELDVGAVQTLLREHAQSPHALWGSWTARIHRPTPEEGFANLDYWKRTMCHPAGSQVSYVGTGCMLAPVSAFRDHALLWELPRRFHFVEDLWLCAFYVCHRSADSDDATTKQPKRSLRASASRINFIKDQEAERVALYRTPGMWNTKTAFLRWLVTVKFPDAVKQGVWPWPWTE